MLRLRDEGVSWQSIDDEIVVLDARASRYLSLRGSGALLWRALADGSTRDDLAALLVDRYGVDADRAQQDVVAFVDDLGERGLLGG